MPVPTVFISYSHDSSEHAERVRGLGASLARDGCECRIDAYKETDEDWPTWMSRQLVEADFVLCVVTETYERHFRDNELPDVGLGVGWEASLIRRLLYGKKLRNDRIFPVVFAKTDRDCIPLELQGYNIFVLDGPDGYEALLRKLQKRPLHAAPDVGVGPVLATTSTAPLFARPSIAVAASPATAISTDISRILKYAPAELIGREHELNLLTAAWQGDLQGLAAYPVISIKHRLKVLSFVALGGEGKTSLIAKWAAELAAEGWAGCDAAFAWSFYSQGTNDQTAASSDLFLKEALLFFAASEEDKQFAASNAGAFEKGQRLARIVGGRRCLLILDGLEPLQYAPTSPTPGELKDHGIAALLKGLATASHGLCVVTTRYSLPDLKAFRQTTAPEVKLLRLSRDAGVHLLKTLGVRGTEQEFETLVEDMKGHALTLTLLGGFLRRAFHGDIRQRDRVKFEKADEKMDGGRAFRTMAAYEQWLLRDGGDEGRREVAVLRLMGLFDRPADAGCLHALLQPPAIPGLTEPLIVLSEAQRNSAFERLTDAELLSVNRDGSGALVSLDAHPHIREYFSEQLREQKPDTWRAAQRRLYEHLCATTKEGNQPTLEDLRPLYQAVAHGCQAGLHEEVCDKVYSRRILRGTENYSIKKLGAFARDLGAVACFFETPWMRPSSALRERRQAWVLNRAALYLRALGRLTESLEPMRAAVDLASRQQDWNRAASYASNLSGLELTVGEVAGAVGDAEHSVTNADRSGDAFWKLASRATHADALHQAGRRVEAETRFREAEAMQQEMQPDYPLLHSLAGFQYCDLLLAASGSAAWQTGDAERGTRNAELMEACRAVSQRTAQMLTWEERMQSVPLLDFGLLHLTLGRAALYAAILGGGYAPSAGRRADQRQGVASTIETARRELDAAVSGLRRSNRSDYLPHALLTRAWLHFFTGANTDTESAQADLDEAWEIAERGPMRLFLAEIFLYRARLFGRPKPEGGKIYYPWESPAADLAAAEKLINACGYHRRDEELADAKRVILGIQSITGESNAKAIANQLNQLATITKRRSQDSLTAAIRILETAAVRFFNALFGWDLVSLKAERKPDYLATDLGDYSRRIAIQITTEDEPDKIMRTAAKAVEGDFGMNFDHLIVFFLLPKKPDFPKELVQRAGGPKIETWDLADLLKRLQDLHDLDALSRAAKVLDEDILGYHIRTRGGGRPLNEAKLILVGRGKAGKTCVVNRLVREVFEDTTKTEGIAITQWPLQLVGQEAVRLHVWDFGGQEIMHSTHQFFLSQRSLYLLVIEGRQGGEDADAEYWLQLIESFGGDSPVIVVLNKTREHAFDLNRRGLQGKYPSIREFVRADCKYDIGIGDLRTAIERETSQLKDLRVPFPASWITIKEELSGMAERGENYISFERYRALCEEMGEKDPQAQDTLAGYLHSLGIALNYRDDPRLHDMNVLSPHWVTNGIYKLLNWPELEARRGVLRLDDLAAVLDPKTYPRDKHLFLLDLMRRFELCFEFPDDKERRYLVPDLLGKQEPAETGVFAPIECLNFQYHYNILPEGLLSRFIVRTHGLSEHTKVRWRTGVVLEFEGLRALVKAEVLARKVFISVQGEPGGRRRLLAVIRSDFERIHSDIKKLEAVEMVPVPRRPEVTIPYADLRAYEDAGDDEYKIVLDGKPVKLSVQALLDGVDIEGSRRRERKSDRDMKSLNLFYSYSHKDESLRNELETHLKLLQRQGIILPWHDRKITAGTEWSGQIDRNLESADIILLLVSADFIASDYCYDLEMKRALEWHEAGSVRVIPVILRDVDWQSAPFARLQALPKDGKPILRWRDRDSAWKDVALGIRRAAEELAAKINSR